MASAMPARRNGTSGAMKYIVKRSGVNGNRTISARHSGIEIAYASVKPAARSMDDGHAPFEEMQDETAKAPAEQSHRHDDEGEVVPDRRRVDAGEADLEDESGKGDEKNAEMDGHAPRQGIPEIGGAARRSRGRAGTAFCRSA